MTRDQVELFGIANVSDYLKLCVQSVDELEVDQASVLRGFTAIVLLNHIPDWLHWKLLGNQRFSLGMDGLTTDKDVRVFFENENADLVLVRSIANGFKHLRPAHGTESISGYGSGPYGIGPFGRPYLLIDLGNDFPADQRWDTGLGLCRRVFAWWQERLKKVLGHSEAGS